MSNGITYPELRDVLTDVDTTNHFQRMFAIGTELYHESAFALYRGVGGHSVSGLLMPEITSTDIIDELRDGQHTTIDMTPIVRNDEGLAIEENPYRKLMNSAMYDLDELVISATAKRAIQRIKSEPDFTGEEVENLVLHIIKKEVVLPKSHSYANRDDIIATFHNHPQNPIWHEQLDALLVPSQADMLAEEKLRASSPGVIGGVVASDRETQGVILYAADHTATQNPYLYDESITGKDSASRVAASLALAGYKSVALQLNRNGKLISGQREAIRSFADS